MQVNVIVYVQAGFVNEQIEEESTMRTILDKINLVGNDKAGYFHIDKELEAMAAARPETNTAAE